MKYMRKIFAMVLAVMMVMSLAIGASADTITTGTITVENPLDKQTYTAYKIFDVVYNANADKYSYTIDANSEWMTVIAVIDEETGVATSRIDDLTLTRVGTSTTYNVATTDTFSAGDFSAVLKENVGEKTGTELKANADGTVSVSGLDLGYYFVTSTSGALCNLTTTNPDASIRDKNDMPFDKTADDVSVEVGQIVNYKIEGKVPDTTGFTIYTYKVTDTMTEGMTFQKDVEVTIGGETFTPSEDRLVYTDNGFTLTIPVMDYQEKVGDEIVITYSAKVNENAISKVSSNKAQLEYTNNPNGDTTKTPEDIVKVYTAKVVIDKYETGKETTKLAGAEFVLYKEVTTGEDNDATTSIKYYKYDEENDVVSWVDSKDDATKVTTNDKGTAEFKGLEDGTYYLEETKAPAGYNQLTGPQKVEVKGSNADDTKLTVTAKVANSTGSTLPSTGGMGTTIFYVAGAMLVLAAAVLLVTKRRMTTAE